MASFMEQPAKRRMIIQMDAAQAQQLKATTNEWSLPFATAVRTEWEGGDSSPSNGFSHPSKLLLAGFKQLPAHLSTADWQYLVIKGAITVPTIELRDELLRSYARYVHPLLPMLDLREFIMAIEGNGASVSLLLYQAVMFAATQFVEMDLLIAEGFPNRQTARKALFQKAKILYEMDCEEDALATVQALQLLTSWTEIPTPLKDASHWSSLATSIARSVGMNQISAHAVIPEQQRRIWRRTWWSCVMRDRMIACGWNRTMCIRSDDFNIPMLEVEDFDLEEFPSQILATCTDIMGPSQTIPLAKICIALARLSINIADILNLQYCIRSSATLGIHGQRPTMRLVPKQGGSDIYEVVRCDEQLHSWFSDSSLVLRLYDEYQADSSESSAVIALHAAVLKGIYFCALNALHRPQMSHSLTRNEPSLVAEIYRKSGERVDEATDNITELFQKLLDYRMIRYLPSFSTTLASFAAVFHIIQLKTSSPSIRQSSFAKLEIIVRALEELKGMYAQVDYVLDLIRVAFTSIKNRSSLAASTQLSSKITQQYQPFSQDLLSANTVALLHKDSDECGDENTYTYSPCAAEVTPGPESFHTPAQVSVEAMLAVGTLTEGEQAFLSGLNLSSSSQQEQTRAQSKDISQKKCVPVICRNEDDLPGEEITRAVKGTRAFGPDSLTSNAREHQSRGFLALVIPSYDDFDTYFAFDKM